MLHRRTSCIWWRLMHVTSRHFCLPAGPGVGSNSWDLTPYRYIKDRLTEHISHLLAKSATTSCWCKIMPDHIQLVSIKTTWESPGLNSLEHDWDNLKRRIQTRDPENLHQHNTLIEEEWTGILQDFFHKLVFSKKNLTI